MTDKYLGTNEWYTLLAKLVKHTGDQKCPHLLAKACQRVSGYNSTLITAYPRNRRPVYIYSNLPANQINHTLTPYFDGAYLLDPFYALCQNEAPNGIYRLADLAPDEFYESEYYHSYYEATQLRDEAGLLIRVTPDLYIVVSLGLRAEDALNPTIRFKDLQTISAMLVSICEQFWSGHSIGMEMLGGAVDCNQPLYGESLDRTFMNFGRDYLSERECEVIRLILKGHSSKSIARVLDISPDTVKVHRKRFHAKLNVSSQAELFSLFLDAISLAPLNSNEDPLSYYFAEYPCRKAS